MILADTRKRSLTTHKGMKVDAHERKTRKYKLKANRRQASYRQRQVSKGLVLFQIRISRMVHDKALKLCQSNADKPNLCDFYQQAINDVNDCALPSKPIEPISGDLVGTRPVTPWMTPESVQRFESLAKQYKSRSDAMTAIVNEYCEKLETCSERR